MKINNFTIFAWGCLLGRVTAWAPELNVTAPPDCSIPCVLTYVPKYCDSLTNLTCVCTNVNLTIALETCVLAACNVTDSLRLENYKAQTCGVKNDRSHQNQDMRLHLVLTPLVFLFIASRVYIRIKLDGLGIDDYAMVAAGFFYITSAAIAFPSTMMGYGLHTWYLAPSTIIISLKFFYTSELLYGFTLTFTKLSLLLFFRRVFPNRSIQRGSIYVGAFIVASNVSVMTAMATQCIPVHGNWTNWMYKVPPIKCIDSFVVIIFFAAISIFHDLIILIMPLPILWGLQLNWKKKTHAMFMFSVGLFVIICSAIRLPVLLRMRYTMDPSYDQAPVALWSYLEQAIGIICGCLPAFRSLLGYLFPSLRQGALGSSGDNSKQSGNSSSSHHHKHPSRRVEILHSRSRTQPDIYDRDDIEMNPKAGLSSSSSSQEQIVHVRELRGDEGGDRFRLVPLHRSGEKMGTTVEVGSTSPRGRSGFMGGGGVSSEASTLRGGDDDVEATGMVPFSTKRKGGGGGGGGAGGIVAACPRAQKMVRVLSSSGNVGVGVGGHGGRDGVGEIKVTQTVHVVERRPREVGGGF